MEESAPISEVLSLVSGFVETVDIFVRRYVRVGCEGLRRRDRRLCQMGYCCKLSFAGGGDVCLVTETRMEMKRVNVELPCIHARVNDIRGAIVTSLIQELHPGGQLDELLVKNVFKVQQELIYLSHCK